MTVCLQAGTIAETSVSRGRRCRDRLDPEPTLLSDLADVVTHDDEDVRFSLRLCRTWQADYHSQTAQLEYGEPYLLGGHLGLLPKTLNYLRPILSRAFSAGLPGRRNPT
jgi:hypothetical protein